MKIALIYTEINSEDIYYERVVELLSSTFTFGGKK